MRKMIYGRLHSGRVMPVRELVEYTTGLTLEPGQWSLEKIFNSEADERLVETDDGTYLAFIGDNRGVSETEFYRIPAVRRMIIQVD